MRIPYIRCRSYKGNLIPICPVHFLTSRTIGNSNIGPVNYRFMLSLFQLHYTESKTYNFALIIPKNYPIIPELFLILSTTYLLFQKLFWHNRRVPTSHHTHYSEKTTPFIYIYIYIYIYKINKKLW